MLALAVGVILPCLVHADVIPYRSSVQAEPALLSFYPIDGDTAPTATDRVAPLQNGTLSGATFSSAAGTIGAQSIQGARVALGPVSDYEFADGSGTVEMFLYQTGTAGFNPCFFAGRDDSTSPAVRYSLHGDAAGGRLWIWNGSSALNVNTPFNMLNQLVHVAYVFNAGLVTVYFNGVVLATWNEPLGSGLNRPFQIGASGPGNQEAWPGRIDEVAIYGEALPGPAIAAHYAAWRTTNAGAAPVIIQQPQDLALDEGQTATFTVQLADVTGAIHRWTRNGTNLPGATNATLILPAVGIADNNSIFRCVIYNPFGGTNTIPALLAVRTPPSFVVAPADTVAYITQSGSLSAVVDGSLPLRYQWFKDGAARPGATNASLDFAAFDVTNSGAYVLTVTNVFGAITSAPAVLAVVPVSILSPPRNAVRFAGQAVSFGVTAAGAGPLAYQWFQAASPLPGQTNPILNLPPVTLADAVPYSVRVTNSYGSTNTPGAWLTVLDVTTPQEVRTPPPFEWLPQDNGASADAVVLFNEVLYHSVPGQSPALQWIELHNMMRVDVDLSRWQLDGGIHYTFPSNTVVPGGAFVLVAGDVNVFTNATGIPNVFGPFHTNLSNGGERIILRNHAGRLMDEMTFGDEQPWPAGADGSGATLAKRTPSSASAEPIHWAASTRLGGTPGAANFPSLAPPALALNELDASTNATFRVELGNRGATSLELAGFALLTTSTNGATNFALPALTLPAGGFAVFDSAQTGFQPAPNDKIFLLASNDAVLVDAATVKNQGRARSPDGTGRWMRPTAASFGASNVVAIIRDIVINEILYEAAPDYPSNVYTGSDEQWIELFNRGTNTVNLGGWSLDNAIQYDFPGHTMLAPGGYLVVAKNAAALQAAHPGRTVLGDFSGRLARPTDLIELKDAGQRVVSEVRYYRGGRWPDFAAGGGSSLELIDPSADARRAESWAASDESGRTAWETITYRGVASTNKGFNIGYNIWNEFVLGLLDAGEFLLDDVSVLELPGTPQVRPLIQNGSFEGDAPGSTPATWRIQGTHGQHGRTRVEMDPLNAGNKVLHVVASGPMDFLQNHLETTLKSGGSIVSIVAGREYEISFRAKWLGGARLLNTRLYFKWLQRTTALRVPASGGTPGAVNSRRIASAGPTYAGLTHAPVVPSADVPVTVRVNAYDPQDVAALTLFWRVDGAVWQSTPMTPDPSPSPGAYRGTVPGQSAGTKIQFYVQGRDTVGGESFFPAKGTNSRALFVFNDGRAAPAPDFNLRFVMTAADTATLYFSTNRMSNDRLGATVIYNESDVYYDVGVRLKGSAFGRNNDTETGLSLDFDPGRKFRGAHDSISIERGGSKREILAKHLFNQAGQGVTAGYDDVAQILTPRVQDTGRGFLSMTRTTDTMLDTQYGGGGTVYNFELLYTPTSTVNGNPEAPKLNFPYVHNNGFPDLQDLGDDKEVYRWNFQVRNNRDRDDFSLLMAAAKSFEFNGAMLDAQAREVIDVNQWLRCFATESLVGNDDVYTRFYNHNLRFYQRPGDNRLVAVPWDLDRAFNLPTTATLWGSVPDMLGGLNRLRKLIEYPPNLRAYYAHLLDLVATSYNSAYATRWANHYAALTLDNNIAGYANYIASRAAHVLSQIPAFPAFSITTSNGLDFSANTNLVTLTGGAPLAMRYVSVNGAVFDPGWPSSTAWSVPLALPAGTHALVVQALDAQRQVISNMTDTITVTVTRPADDPVGRIVINEIMYHPPAPGAEFVELFNTSATTAFDLGGWRLNGTALAFDRATLLPPRGFLVLPADRLALAQIYGYGIPSVTEYPGRLDLDGETLSLIKPATSNSAEVVVDRVRYEPVAPWGTVANGGGPSLQLIDSAQDNARVSNWSDGRGWRFASLTGFLQTNSTNIILFTSGSGGEVYLDDITLVAGAVPAVGPNLLANGDFESPLSGSWSFVGTNQTNSALATNRAHGGTASLRLVGTASGSQNQCLRQFITPPAVSNQYTISFWYLSSTNGTNMQIRSISGIGVSLLVNFRPPAPATPGTTNSVTAPVPGYPTVWLNEVRPGPSGGRRDQEGEFEPWLELYNSGSSPVSLEGCFLSEGYLLLNPWAFPTGALLNPGEFKVIVVDGEPDESTTNEWHTSFRLEGGSGSLALAQDTGAGLRLLDYFNYAAVPNDQSYGSVPDGQPFYRGVMFYPTAGATNDGRAAPLRVFINEWMAVNTGASGFADPADGDDDDWFELFNPGPAAVDLGGSYLTDNLTNPLQYPVPNNGHYTIPAGGYLLVWADGEAEQNNTNQADLHVSFSLRAAGEAIGLFAADGTLIDAVSFTNQTANVSQGRSPDGGGTIVFLPTPSPRAANVSAPAAPIITRIEVEGVTVTLTFSTVAGRSYQVEYKDDLGAVTWMPLGGAWLAAGSSQQVIDTPVTGPQRFYRVFLRP